MAKSVNLSAGSLGVILLLAALVGGGIFLVTWDIPAPSQAVVKDLSDDRFPS